MFTRQGFGSLRDLRRVPLLMSRHASPLRSPLLPLWPPCRHGSVTDTWEMPYCEYGQCHARWWLALGWWQVGTIVFLLIGPVFLFE